LVAALAFVAFLSTYKLSVWDEEREGGRKFGFEMPLL
jgi:hypothetical protein